MTEKQTSLKPKILITAGLDGTENVAISTAMNFINYIRKKFFQKNNFLDSNCVMNLSVHQLVNNFRIFVVPMVSPQAVFKRSSKVPTFSENETEKDQKYKSPAEKLVRMDFGVRSQRLFDVSNPKCFETNGALFLAQLMQRHIFAAVLDLKQGKGGKDNKIVFPYGFIPANIAESGKKYFVEF